MKTSLLTTGLPIDFAAPNLQPQARADASTSFADNLRSASDGWVAPPSPAPSPAPAPQAAAPAPAPAPTPAQQRAQRRDEHSDARRAERDDRRDERRADAQGVERRDARRDVRRDERDDRRDARRADRRDRRLEHAKDEAAPPVTPGVDAAATDEPTKALPGAEAGVVDPKARPVIDPAAELRAAAAQATADATEPAAESARALAADAQRRSMQAASSTDAATAATDADADARTAAIDPALLGMSPSAHTAQARGRHGAQPGARGIEPAQGRDNSGDASPIDTDLAMPKADAAVEAEAPRASSRQARGARAGDGDSDIARRGAESDAARDAGRGADRAVATAELPAALWRDVFPLSSAFGAGHGAGQGTGHAAPAVSAIGAVQAAAGGAAASATGPVPEHTIAAPPGSADFTRALSSQVTLWARDGTQEARLQLNPADLGPVTVMIAIDGAQARVDFQAHAAATRDAIEASLPSLANALNEQGLTLSGGGVFDRSGRDAHAQQAQGQAAQARGDGADRGTDLDDTAPRGATAARAMSARGLVDLVA